MGSRTGENRPELNRTYRCPQCGYDGFKMGNVRGTIDFSIQAGCPRCMTVDGVMVFLEETSDPRGDGLAVPEENT